MENTDKEEVKEKIDSILVMCDSYDRFPKFLEIVGSLKLSGELYWYALRKSYEICDNLFQYRKVVKKAFSRSEPDRNIMMTSEELELLNNLPDEFPIYRGMTFKEYNSGDFGVSWTLKKEVAEFFAFSYRRNFSTDHLPKTVHQVEKSDILTTLDRFRETMHFRLPKTTLS